MAINIQIINNCANLELISDTHFDDSTLSTAWTSYAEFVTKNGKLISRNQNFNITVYGIKDGTTVYDTYNLTFVGTGTMGELSFGLQTGGLVRIGSTTTNRFKGDIVVTILENTQIEYTDIATLTPITLNATIRNAIRVTNNDCFFVGYRSDVGYLANVENASDYTASRTEFLDGTSNANVARRITKNGVIAWILYARCNAVNAIAGNTATYKLEVTSTDLQITNNLVNASIDKLTFSLSETNSYTVTPNALCYFTQSPKLTIDGVDLPFTLSNDVYTLSVDGTQYANAQSVSVSGNATSYAIAIGGGVTNATLNQNYIDKRQSNTITVTPNADCVFADVGSDEYKPKLTIDGVALFFEIVNGVYTLTVDGTEYATSETATASGRAFSSADVLNIDFSELQNITPTADSATQSVYQFVSLVKVRVNSGYTLDGNITIANYPFIYDSVNDLWYCQYQRNTNITPKVKGRAIKTTDLISDFGFIRAFKITSKQLAQSLTNKRFYNSDTQTYEDLGEYILSFVRYPFNVPTSDETTVKYGFFDTNITAPLAEEQIHEISLGKKLISGLYGNSSDIAQCKIELLLPYCDLHEIDSKYINTQIEVVYKVDILSNTANVLIYSDDVLIDIINTSIGYDIPYILKTDRVTPNVNLKSNVLKSYKAKAIVSQKPKINGIAYQTALHCRIAETSGFNRCENVTLALSADMTLTEQKAIVQMLESGYIM